MPFELLRAGAAFDVGALEERFPAKFELLGADATFVVDVFEERFPAN